VVQIHPRNQPWAQKQSLEYDCTRPKRCVAAFGNNPDGSTTCGDGATLNQTCYLVSNPNFGKLQVINALNGPRVMQFASQWTF
jgi:hypothetical protein